ncbi:SDR family oxidoreductase [Streptomyces sp. NPDC002928]|uniref:SDR family oxidoreductase n=1 Tax=Streptomyces sp. NPDC002928 TaxID=3154440 RepID=UPI0033BFA7E2
MIGPLKDETVLVIGRGGGIARAVVLAARNAGARVIAAGRDQYAPAAYAGEADITTETVDLTDEATIAALGNRLDSVDRAVFTASARARGRLADLDRDAVRLSFDAKVIGPLMPAKRLAPRISETASLTLFSGVAAAKIAVGTLAVAITDGAADILARSLALELAPIRVDAISRGDRHRRLGRPGRAGLGGPLRRQQRPQPGTSHRHRQCRISARSPARRIGTANAVSAPAAPHAGSAPPATSPMPSCSP